MTILEAPVKERKATKHYLHAPYWRDDNTLNPTIVRLIQRTGDFFDVRFPDGHVESVHLHTLGVFR